MDYLCAKFGNFSFSRFGFIVRTESHRQADDSYTHMATVGMSKYICKFQLNCNEQTSQIMSINNANETLNCTWLSNCDQQTVHEL